MSLNTSRQTKSVLPATNWVKDFDPGRGHFYRKKKSSIMRQKNQNVAPDEVQDVFSSVCHNHEKTHIHLWGYKNTIVQRNPKSNFSTFLKNGIR